MRVIYVPISDEDLERLRLVAQRERRRPQDQASVLLEQSLRRVGDRDVVAAGPVTTRSRR